jgi:hypothetical protein
MAQSGKPRKPRGDPPLKVRTVFAKPSKEGDEAWLRALRILLATEPAEEADGGTTDADESLLRRR